MDIVSIILLSIGLAMDCFAVSTTKGIGSTAWHKRALLMAALFGLFQGLMPLIGYYAGSIFTTWVCRFDHWIALLLLSFIGGKMVVESRQEKTESVSADWSVKTLLLLSVATSIDALATGVLFVPQPQVLWLAVVIIALTSLLFSLIGYALGLRLGKHLPINPEMLGGVILVLIGLKIFIEHAFINGELIH